MANRITNSDLEAVFGRLVRGAQSNGKDTANWVFGQHTGLSYYVANRDPKNGGVSQVSPLWASKREAYYGMMSMCYAYEAL